MDVCASLVADGQPAILSEPCECSLDDPAMSSELGLRLDAHPRDAMHDSPRRAGSAAPGVVIALVGVNLLGPPTRMSAPSVADRRDRVEQRLEQHRVVQIGWTCSNRQRHAGRVDDQMVLCAGLGAVRRVRAELLAPLFAGTLRASTLARLQSMRSASASRRSSSTCSSSHTPARCQSRRRRQQVTPPPQPISAGNAIHGIPVLSTNTMPVKAARSSTNGRPPFGCGRWGGSKGSTIAHSSSSISFFMHGVKHPPCPGYETRS